MAFQKPFLRKHIIWNNQKPINNEESSDEQQQLYN